MGRLLIVTHGPVDPGVPNPGISSWEIEDINNCVVKLYSEKPPRVICGTGKRHEETAKLLGLMITAYSPLVGNADIVISNESVILADGTKLEYRMYSCLGDDPELVKTMLSPLLKTNGESIVIADPELIKGLDIKHPKLATVYRFMMSGSVEL